MSTPKLRTDDPQAFLMSRLSTRSVMEFPREFTFRCVESRRGVCDGSFPSIELELKWSCLSQARPRTPINVHFEFSKLQCMAY